MTARAHHAPHTAAASTTPEGQAPPMVNVRERQGTDLLSEKLEEAAALLAEASRNGVDLTLVESGLRLSGPDPAVEQLAPTARRLKSELRRLIEETAHRLWLIEQPDGRVVSSSFTPPATRSELERWYPHCRAINQSEEA